MTVELRASEEQKEALLREVHHRVKNNLAVIGRLFYLESTHSKDEETVHIFQDMADRASCTDHDRFILKPFHRRELQSTIEVAMLRRTVRAKEKNQ